MRTEKLNANNTIPTFFVVSCEHAPDVVDLIAEMLIIPLAEFKFQKHALPPTLLETVLKPLLETVEEDEDGNEFVSGKYEIALRVCKESKLQIALEEVH